VTLTGKSRPKGDGAGAVDGGQDGRAVGQGDHTAPHAIRIAGKSEWIVARPPTAPVDSEMDKALYVREMFAAIAPRYDRANRLLTRASTKVAQARVAELAAPRGGSVVDLCCGTGDLVFHLLRTDPRYG